MRKPDYIKSIVNKAVECDESFYFTPNLDATWLRNLRLQAFRSTPRVLKSLFVGGVLYAGLTNKGGGIVDAVEVNPLSALSQLYIINAFSKENTLELLLLDKYFNNNVINPVVTYSENELSGVKQCFYEFIGEEDEDLFMKVFSLKKSGNNFVRIFPKDNGLKIINDVIELGLKPAYPTNVYVTNIMDFEGSEYDFISSNNVINYVNPTMFIKKLSELLRSNGVAEVTLLLGAEYTLPPKLIEVKKSKPPVFGYATNFYLSKLGRPIRVNREVVHLFKKI